MPAPDFDIDVELVALALAEAAAIESLSPDRVVELASAFDRETPSQWLAVCREYDAHPVAAFLGAHACRRWDGRQPRSPAWRRVAERAPARHR